VSSLGAIPSFTTKSLEKLFQCRKRTLSLWLKRISIAAIRGSMLLFYNIKIREEDRAVLADIDEFVSDGELRQEDAEEENLQEALHTRVLEEANEELEMNIKEPRIEVLEDEGERETQENEETVEFQDAEEKEKWDDENQECEEEDPWKEREEIVGEEAQREMDEV
jgi:hypothetical protein